MLSDPVPSFPKNHIRTWLSSKHHIDVSNKFFIRLQVGSGSGQPETGFDPDLVSLEPGWIRIRSAWNRVGTGSGQPGTGLDPDPVSLDPGWQVWYFDTLPAGAPSLH